MKAKVLSNINHDGTTYSKGDTFEGDEATVATLIAAGALRDKNAPEAVDAEADAQVIIDEAKAEAVKITDAAKAKGEDILKSAKDLAKSITDDAKAAADKAAAEAK